MIFVKRTLIGFKSTFGISIIFFWGQTYFWQSVWANRLHPKRGAHDWAPKNIHGRRNDSFRLSFFLSLFHRFRFSAQRDKLSFSVCTLYGLTEIVSSYIVPSPSSRVDGHLNRSCLIGLGPGCTSGGG
jgi:hypothetical protein